MKKPKDIRISKEVIYAKNHKIPLLVLRPDNQTEKRVGVLWIHGGGYFLGMKEMVYMSRALDLVRRPKAKKEVSPYAAPARQKDYSGLPPAYTFVGSGEPFFEETKAYIHNLKAAGIPAKLDIYDMDMHAFDMLKPNLEVSRIAARKFNEEFAYAMEHYYTE